MKFGTFGPSKLVASATSTPTTPTMPSVTNLLQYYLKDKYILMLKVDNTGLILSRYVIPSVNTSDSCIKHRM